MGDDVEFVEPGTDDLVDVSPGGDTPDELLSEPNEEINYEAAAETWIGDQATVELRIDPLDDQEPKRFLLEEPDAEATYRIITAVLDQDRYQLCDAIVQEPALSREMWDTKLTGRERTLLYDHAFAWVRVGDFVSVQEQIQ